MRRTLSSVTSRYASAALLLAGLAVFSNSALGSEPSGLRVRNSTRSFKIVAVEKSDDGDYLLSLKNEYAKAITAFRVFLPNSETTLRRSFLESRKSIAPGAVEVIEIPAQGLKSPGGESVSSEANVLITAVAFEDKTGDGKAEALAEIEAERFAEKAQLTRAVSQLRKMLEASDTQLIASLDSLRPENWAFISDSGVASLLVDFRAEKSPSSGSSDEAIARGLRCGLTSGLKKAEAIFAELDLYRSIDDGTPAVIITAKVRELSVKLLSDYEKLIEKL